MDIELYVGMFAKENLTMKLEKYMSGICSDSTLNYFEFLFLKYFNNFACKIRELFNHNHCAA